MEIEWKDISEKDLLASASIILEGVPVLEFELYKDYYVADWDSKVSQYEFLEILDKLGCPSNAPTIIQSKEKYPKKRNTTLGEVISLQDDIVFLAFDTDEYSMTWYKQKSPERIEFSSEKKSLDLLVKVLNYTFDKFGDVAKADIEKILHEYEE